MKRAIFYNSNRDIPDFLAQLEKLVGLKIDQCSDNILHWKDESLQLMDKRFAPILFDFVKWWNYHRHSGAPQGPLKRALGKGENLVVWDLTCGQGADSILMLFFGARVIAFERNPVIGAMLLDAQRRALQDGGLGPILGDRFTLHLADARQCDCQPLPDVIYLDPMYPEKKKSALACKEMRIFKEVVGEDTDADQLLEWAISLKAKRVIIKRNILAPSIYPPDTSYKGKSTRYDVYFTRV